MAEPQSTSEALPALIAGKYRPVRCMAQGGMGSVYEVENINTGDHWALKVLREHVALDSSTVERFRREARISGRVKTEHIVRVIDVDVAPELKDSPYIVMELLEGQTLAEAAGSEPQAPLTVVDWIQQVCRALEKAHSQGIIHRDLKPENLFLTMREDGTPIVKILDFGIAKIRGGDGGKQTTLGSVLGTPQYMSPEQATGDSSAIGPWTDVWAIGMTAFRLLTGRNYWSAKGATSVLAKIVYEPIAPPSAKGCTLGEQFDEWFLRSCNREASERFSDVREQVVALGEALRCPVPTWSLPPAITEQRTPVSVSNPDTETAVPTAVGSPSSEATMGATIRTAEATTEPAIPEAPTTAGKPNRRSISRVVVGAVVVAGTALVLLALSWCTGGE